MVGDGSKPLIVRADFGPASTWSSWRQSPVEPALLAIR
jgi:hypothetical protein